MCRLTFQTVERALSLLPPSAIVVRLSGHAQTDDRRAIREMGRQIALAEGKSVDEEDDDDVPGDTDFAPTTLPSHLLALLTAPSPRAIIVVIDEFDLFTEHARQALLYCLLDVVQSVQTGAVERTGRGMAVIGITSRVVSRGGAVGSRAHNPGHAASSREACKVALLTSRVARVVAPRAWRSGMACCPPRRPRAMGQRRGCARKGP